jgi:glycosyltransferase involved in cell wall biosynthesis
MKTAVVILSFNRPHYLKQVVDSLLKQTQKDFDYWLFQDGIVNKFSWRVSANQEDVDKCIEIFTDAFPSGKVEHSKSNIGIALNWQRAEEKIFLDEEYEQAIFLEDDLVLSSSYMETMNNLFEQFGDDSRISFFNAYGERMKFEGSSTTIKKMEHVWGVGMVRKQWLERYPSMLEFYNIVGSSDYRMRPFEKIAEFYAKRGIKSSVALGQDGCKCGIALLHNQIKISPCVNLAKYIGKEGFHSNAAHYEKNKFEHFPIIDKPVKNFNINYDEIEKRLRGIYLQ